MSSSTISADIIWQFNFHFIQLCNRISKSHSNPNHATRY